MKTLTYPRFVCTLSFVFLILVITGCGSGTVPAQKGPSTTVATADAHNLDGWWCSEHGVPEEECSLCSSDAAVKFKEKGDWCKQHDRADSQCFVCHPELQEKFAARYEAKYGKKPPQPTE